MTTAASLLKNVSSYKEGGLTSILSTLKEATNFNYNSYFTNTSDWWAASNTQYEACWKEIQRLTEALKVTPQTDQYNALRTSIENNRNEFYKYSYDSPNQEAYYEPIYCGDLWDDYEKALENARNTIIHGASGNNNYNQPAKANDDADTLDQEHSDLSLGHKGVAKDDYQHVTTKATCTTAGTRELYYVCSRCTAALTYEYYYDNAGDEFHSDAWAPQVKNDIPAANHHFVVNTTAKAPTCLADGVKASWVCGNQTTDPNADNYFDDTTHDFSKSNCVGVIYGDANGTTTLTSTVAPATGHKLADPVIENQKEGVDCQHNGSHDEVVYCQNTNCPLPNKEYSREAKEDGPGPHVKGDPQRENVIEATCASEGSYDLVTRCTLCKIILEEEKDQTIEKLSHDLEEKAGKAASCLTPGWEKYWQCKNEACGHQMFADADAKEAINAPKEIAATGHVWDDKNEELAPATCLVSGTRVYYHCKNCGLYFKENNVKAAESSAYQDKSETVIPASGHDFSGEAIQAGKPATCTEDGVKAHFHCMTETTAEVIGCGLNYEQGSETDETKSIDTTIKALGHDYGEEEEVEIAGT
ncbi:MAG: hypothetical protein J1E05_05795, partial [Eubacterium sp.]|nr:hypothetical protein [Eubacterium sp.]